MTARSLVYAPSPVFSQTAKPFTSMTDELRQLGQDLADTMYVEKGIGIAAPMVGVMERVIVVDLNAQMERNPEIYYNPEIVWASDEMQTNKEGSLCYPGIDAEITRPKSIRMRYVDEAGEAQEREAHDFHAQVIQHEIDYLHGIVYLDYLSKMKSKMLIKKMLKVQRLENKEHVHGPGCGHDH